MTIDIMPVKPGELGRAIHVLAKAFATQPSFVSLYRENSDLGGRIGLVFKAMLDSMPGEVFVAKLEGEIVGAMQIVQWPGCQMKLSQGVKMLPILIRSGGIGLVLRGMKMRGTWAKRDPKKPHWHLEVLGTLPELQGNGIGSAMMKYYCSRVDKEVMAAYHETDRPENVKFYQKFGYEVIGEEKILNFDNWYLWRDFTSKQ